MTSGPTVEVEDQEEGVRVLTLHNAARRNALDPSMLEDLARALDPAAGEGVRAILIRGGDVHAFCSGYDLGALAEADASADSPLPDDRLAEVLAMLADHPAPSVALIDGAAFGAGCELACTCDFRIGTPDAVFSMPPAKLGIAYAPEGLARLAALVGLPRAKRMFFTGTRVDAETAEAWGLIDELMVRQGAQEMALGLCHDIARNAPLAVAGMKKAFAALTRTNLTPGDRQAIREMRRRAYLSEDAREGKAAFAEKRRPRFRGR